MKNEQPDTRRKALLLASALLAFLCVNAVAQDEASPTKTFKEEELASLLAPIALYPDSVVTQILMASTYPLEVVEASRWVKKNSTLEGEALASAANKQPWDPSVQALTAMPDVLKMMDEKLDWTQKVGDAFLAQQKDVMDMIQTLRAKAKEAGNLESDDHMKVTTEAAPATAEAAATTTTQVIVIESADPQVIYVPTYSPVSVYGYWGYPAYPPYYWPPPVGYPGTGFWYGVGIGISISYWGGHYNNCYPNWHGGDIYIGDINIDRGDRNNINGGDRNNVNTGDRASANNRSGAQAGATDRSGGQSWSHDPDHRKGVSYRDNATSSKYGGASQAGAGSRDAYRGRPSTGTGNASTGAAPSTGARDLGGAPKSGTSTGSGARDLGGSGGMSSTSTRPSSSGMSGSGSFSSSSSATRSSSSSSAFGGMSSGSRASSYGSRGGASRGGGGGRRR